MSVTVQIPEGYLGQCGCGKDATHSEYMDFEGHLPANPELGLPAIEGTWHQVCDNCCKPSAKHKEGDVR